MARVLVLCGLLGGCSTALRYEPWDGVAPIKAGALRFSLQESALTLARPGAVAATPPVPSDNCPKTATAIDWGACFNYVAASASMAPASAAQGAARPAVYLGEPDDGPHLNLSTTTITGVPVAGQDGLYSSITVGYANNTSKMIAGAGSGAATGFGIAGPYGAAAGFLIGGLAPVMGSAYLGEVQPRRPVLQDYLCKDVDVDLTRAGQLLAKPYVALPVTLSPASSRPFASMADVRAPVYVPSLCWRALPNAAQIGVIRLAPVNAAPLGFGAPDKRAPVQGDGWLYRIVEDGDPKAAPPGAIPAADYFAKPAPRQDFPYSACRKVAIQVTWWAELAAAVDRVSTGQDPKPRAVSFATVAADPAFVEAADMRKGGVITFKPDCGAYVAASVDTSYGAGVNAAVSAAQTIVAAEQTWKAGQVTTAPP